MYANIDEGKMIVGDEYADIHVSTLPGEIHCKKQKENSYKPPAAHGQKDEVTDMDLPIGEGCYNGNFNHLFNLKTKVNHIKTTISLGGLNW